jgi:hypothetical protein
VEFDVAAYALRYSYGEDGFRLKNLSDKPRRFRVDLTSLDSSNKRFRLRRRRKDATVGSNASITLAPQEEAHWTALH